MEIVYIPGDNIAFITFIKQQGVGDKAVLHNVDGHARWVITRDDGTEYIARPEETKPE